MLLESLSLHWSVPVSEMCLWLIIFFIYPGKFSAAVAHSGGDIRGYSYSHEIIEKKLYLISGRNLPLEGNLIWSESNLIYVIRIWLTFECLHKNICLLQYLVTWQGHYILRASWRWCALLSIVYYVNPNKKYVSF